MSRLSRILLVSGLIVFALACNFVTQPIRDAQEAVNTVQSVASSLPLETIQALATSMPLETPQALASALPDFGNMFDPQGEPVSEWNGIPIMSQATAGQEHDQYNYSFKFTGTTQEAQSFYETEMVALGWTSMFSMPSGDNGAVLSYQKGDNVLTITIVTTDDKTAVVLTLV